MPEDTGNEKPIDEYSGEHYFLLGANNKYLHKIDLGVFIKPKYMSCNTCPFAPKNGGECEDFLEDSDCIIERTFFDVLMQSMAEHEITDMDRIIVFPLAQQLFRVNRLYALEQGIDLRYIYDFDDTGKNPTLEIYKELLKMIESNEKGLIQKMKELMATKKERNKIKKRKGKADISFLDVLTRAESD